MKQPARGAARDAVKLAERALARTSGMMQAVDERAARVHVHIDAVALLAARDLVNIRMMELRVRLEEQLQRGDSPDPTERAEVARLERAWEDFTAALPRN